jgi:NADP-dependent aldehyde dehydrogenase
MENLLQSSLEAFKILQKLSPSVKAKFLNDIADSIDVHKDEILATASQETNLPLPRLEIERGRTVFQLRSMAKEVVEGSWQEKVIDQAIPDRQPMPKPEIRKIHIGIGPIVVFGASNFPLAYSTIGGDSVSALAAGCPVIYKVHPSHPRTSHIMNGIIQKVLQDNGLPSGTFIHYETNDFNEVKQLVQHPIVKGVGFTGSYNGGMAIYRYAQERKDPIPVFCEMGSVNPVILLSHALESKAESWANNYCGSITNSVGQFCTNPGLILGIKGDGLTSFTNHLVDAMNKVNAAPMLSESIYKNYENRKDEVLAQTNVHKISSNETTGQLCGQPTIAKVNGSDFISNALLHEEVFGPFSLIVACDDEVQLKSALKSVAGQLTVSIICEPNDYTQAADIRDIAMQKAGRVVFNGIPTGVEVTPAMVHGGPFPASTDSRFTAVGIEAIRRWTRPVSLQNCPPELLIF